MRPELRKTVLVILDGLGINANPVGNAVKGAQTPTLNHLLATAPNATLVTCGERVGLPEGQMGNSEVGHLNIGAGRVVEQWLLRISRALQGEFLKQSAEYRAFLQATMGSKSIHLVGLYSDGGVHSHSDHLALLLARLNEDYQGRINLHLITDGRDTSPQRSLNQVEKLSTLIKQYPRTKVASVVGRFFAMDRDKRWERTRKAYDAVVYGRASKSDAPLKWIEESYRNGETDEFIEPAVFDYFGISPDDGVLFWNFREDRMRQIVRALCVEAFEGFERPTVPFSPEKVLGFTDYDPTYHLPYLFHPIEIANHLGEVVSRHGLSQIRIAETEKYAHVTYFFNGGVENEYPGEHRHVIQSPRDVKTYDEKPEMSAAGVTQAVIDAIGSGKYSFIVVNFANCDMVGHTGDYDATVKAVETVDTCLSQVLQEVEKNGWTALIIADHGNAEQMVNYDDGTPHTAHTTFNVPIIVVGAPSPIKIEDGGALCDVAPTLLAIMGLPQPEEMAGRSLIYMPST